MIFSKFCVNCRYCFNINDKFCAQCGNKRTIIEQKMKKTYKVCISGINKNIEQNDIYSFVTLVTEPISIKMTHENNILYSIVELNSKTDAIKLIKEFDRANVDGKQIRIKMYKDDIINYDGIEMSNKLYISNIPKYITKQNLFLLFEKYGLILRLKKYKKTAIIEYNDARDAYDAYKDKFDFKVNWYKDNKSYNPRKEEGKNWTEEERELYRLSDIKPIKDKWWNDLTEKQREEYYDKDIEYYMKGIKKTRKEIIKEIKKDVCVLDEKGSKLVEEFVFTSNNVLSNFDKKDKL